MSAEVVFVSKSPLLISCSNCVHLHRGHESVLPTVIVNQRIDIVNKDHISLFWAISQELNYGSKLCDSPSEANPCITLYYIMYKNVVTAYTANFQVIKGLRHRTLEQDTQHALPPLPLGVVRTSCDPDFVLFLTAMVCRGGFYLTFCFLLVLLFAQ
jgi:hypothetical protein